ncbi:MAG TPA: nucleotidyltransferase family protein [Alphaproteobacteria bacterium]|nr:nucleotidyltransferase family protein [Alphaproteobacteria bacterium]
MTPPIREPGGPRTAMVLAAGLGKRMRPLTDKLPKPLLPVAGRTLLDRVLDHFDAAGIGRVVINLHYFRDVMEKHLATRQRPPIELSPEPDLLETGGGVKNALPRLGPAPFYVANADVLWLDGMTPALARLARAWNDSTMDALLLLQPAVTAIGYDGGGDYFADPLGRLRWRKANELAPFIFAGVQILHPRLFAHAPEGPFSLKRLYDHAEAAGRLWGLRHDGLWFHVGTPEGLAETEAILGPPRPAR